LALLELAVLEPKILVCGILIGRKHMCWHSSEQGGRGYLTAICFVDVATMIRPWNNDGDLPNRRSGCLAAEKNHELTCEKSLLRDATPTSEDPKPPDPHEA
jgi:hypothetical protein